MARKSAARRRTARKTTPRARSRSTRTSPGRKRYTSSEKSNILQVALKEGLTGAQVRDRFGISTLTFYRWRGPVGRGRRARPQGPARSRKNGESVLAEAEFDVVALREEVRRALRRMLPKVVEEEIETYLSNLLRAG